MRLAQRQGPSPTRTSPPRLLPALRCGSRSGRVFCSSNAAPQDRDIDKLAEELSEQDARWEAVRAEQDARWEARLAAPARLAEQDRPSLLERVGGCNTIAGILCILLVPLCADPSSVLIRLLQGLIDLMR